jgi:hypothetical protein
MKIGVNFYLEKVVNFKLIFLILVLILVIIGYIQLDLEVLLQKMGTYHPQIPLLLYHIMKLSLNLRRLIHYHLRY